ncbi:putative phage abortive infection protein [Kluyvera intermedia]|uniref:putative phage abortive infection protein n=1 Tax=Kluyvera intermedia TaxID=61648 RepID=UPI003D02D3D0
MNTFAQNNQFTVQFFVALGTMLSVLVALLLAFYNRRTQKFDANFTLLLEQHNQQLNSLVRHERFQDNFDYVLAGGGSYGERSLAGAFSRMNQKDMFYSSYFRVLYHLMKSIDKERGLSFSQKKFYTSIIRSLLTFEVLLLLAINVSHAQKFPSYKYFKELIECYSLFEHLPVEDWKLIEGLPDVYTNEIAVNSFFSDEEKNLELITEIILVYNVKAFGEHDSLEFIHSINAKAVLNVN